jgi:hypothetical protein
LRHTLLRADPGALERRLAVSVMPSAGRVVIALAPQAGARATGLAG